MDLNTQQRIELEHLLLQREGAYARVHHAEAEIAKIFGEEYPFPPPPVDVAVPGAIRKKARTPQLSAAKRKKTVPKIRGLDGDESAYRITFMQEGSRIEEVHVDRKSIQGLFKTGAADRIVLSVETLSADGEVVERVYERDE
ncbi:MAG: hypothetical protein ACQKBT_09800 [Puniceicoccales bacterium]